MQLYLCDLYGSVSRPDRQLKQFSKVFLQPGEERNVEFTLTHNDLSFIGRENRRIVELGDFKVLIDKLSAQFTLEPENGKGTY